MRGAGARRCTFHAYFRFAPLSEISGGWWCWWMLKVACVRAACCDAHAGSAKNHMNNVMMVIRLV